MNGKRAKQLRKLALEVFTQPTQYNGSNPSRETMYIKDVRGVIGVAPVCLRYVYQQMKATHKREKTK